MGDSYIEIENEHVLDLNCFFNDTVYVACDFYRRKSDGQADARWSDRFLFDQHTQVLLDNISSGIDKKLYGTCRVGLDGN